MFDLIQLKEIDVWIQSKLYNNYNFMYKFEVILYKYINQKFQI